MFFDVRGNYIGRRSYFITSRKRNGEFRNPLVGDKRLEFLVACYARYKFKLPTTYQPSESTFNLRRRARRRRSADYIPLNKVVSLSGDKIQVSNPLK